MEIILGIHIKVKTPVEKFANLLCKFSTDIIHMNKAFIRHISYGVRQEGFGVLKENDSAF